MDTSTSRNQSMEDPPKITFEHVVRVVSIVDRSCNNSNTSNNENHHQDEKNNHNDSNDSKSNSINNTSINKSTNIKTSKDFNQHIDDYEDDEQDYPTITADNSNSSGRNSISTVSRRNRFMNTIVAAILTVLSYSLLIGVGITCRFLSVHSKTDDLLAITPYSRQVTQTVTSIGIFCSGDYYNLVDADDVMWDISRIFLSTCIGFGTIAVFLMSMVLVGLYPRWIVFQWRIVSILSALCAIFQVPVFLMYQIEPCSDHTSEQHCTMDIGSYLLICSVSCWIMVTIVTQCLDPLPNWVDHLEEWRVIPQPQARMKKNNNMSWFRGDRRRRYPLAPSLQPPMVTTTNTTTMKRTYQNKPMSFTNKINAAGNNKSSSKNNVADDNDDDDVNNKNRKEQQHLLLPIMEQYKDYHQDVNHNPFDEEMGCNADVREAVQLVLVRSAPPMVPPMVPPPSSSSSQFPFNNHVVNNHVVVTNTPLLLNNDNNKKHSIPKSIGNENVSRSSLGSLEPTILEVSPDESILDGINNTNNNNIVSSTLTDDDLAVRPINAASTKATGGEGAEQASSITPPLQTILRGMQLSDRMKEEIRRANRAKEEVIIKTEPNTGTSGPAEPLLKRKGDNPNRSSMKIVANIEQQIKIPKDVTITQILRKRLQRRRRNWNFEIMKGYSLLDDDEDDDDDEDEDDIIHNNNSKNGNNDHVMSPPFEIITVTNKYKHKIEAPVPTGSGLVAGSPVRQKRKHVHDEQKTQSTVGHCQEHNNDHVDGCIEDPEPNLHASDSEGLDSCGSGSGPEYKEGLKCIGGGGFDENNAATATSNGQILSQADTTLIRLQQELQALRRSPGTRSSRRRSKRRRKRKNSTTIGSVSSVTSLLSFTIEEETLDDLVEEFDCYGDNKKDDNDASPYYGSDDGRGGVHTLADDSETLDPNMSGRQSRSLLIDPTQPIIRSRSAPNLARYSGYRVARVGTYYVEEDVQYMTSINSLGRHRAETFWSTDHHHQQQHNIHHHGGDDSWNGNLKAVPNPPKSPKSYKSAKSTKSGGSSLKAYSASLLLQHRASATNRPLDDNMASSLVREKSKKRRNQQRRLVSKKSLFLQERDQRLGIHSPTLIVADQHPYHGYDDDDDDDRHEHSSLSSKSSSSSSSSSVNCRQKRIDRMRKRILQDRGSPMNTNNISIVKKKTRVFKEKIHRATNTMESTIQGVPDNLHSTASREEQDHSLLTRRSVDHQQQNNYDTVIEGRNKPAFSSPDEVGNTNFVEARCTESPEAAAEEVANEIMVSSNHTFDSSEAMRITTNVDSSDLQTNFDRIMLMNSSNDSPISEGLYMESAIDNFQLPTVSIPGCFIDTDDVGPVVNTAFISPTSSMEDNGSAILEIDDAITTGSPNCAHESFTKNSNNNYEVILTKNPNSKSTTGTCPTPTISSTTDSNNNRAMISPSSDKLPDELSVTSSSHRSNSNRSLASYNDDDEGDDEHADWDDMYLTDILDVRLAELKRPEGAYKGSDEESC